MPGYVLKSVNQKIEYDLASLLAITFNVKPEIAFGIIENPFRGIENIRSKRIIFGWEIKAHSAW
ncbi:hypothetical protein D3C73_1527880 [compost metagenome]